MEIMKIVATALTGLILAIVMKSVNKEISIYIVLGTVMIIFLSVADRLAEIFSFLQGIYDNVTYGRTFFPVILKSTGSGLHNRFHRSAVPGRGRGIHRFQSRAGR